MNFEGRTKAILILDQGREDQGRISRVILVLAAGQLSTAPPWHGLRKRSQEKTTQEAKCILPELSTFILSHHQLYVSLLVILSPVYFQISITGNPCFHGISVGCKVPRLWPSWPASWGSRVNKSFSPALLAGRGGSGRFSWVDL